MKKLADALFLAVLVLVVSYSPVGATSGTLTITTSRTLTEDHNGNIVIATDGVVLNCAGHTVAGNGSGTGIEIIGITGATVTNCQVTNFRRGVFLQAASNNILQRNVISNNAEEGFELERSDANTFINNRVNENGRDGFDLDDSHGNIFIRNAVIENTLNGIELDRSSNNVFLGNTANNNGRNPQGMLIEERSGFSLDSANNNFFRGNTANRNSRNGFRLDSSSDNTLMANRANGNEGRDVGFIDQADCKQIGISIRNQFLSNVFTNPDDCIFRLPGD